MRKPTPVIPRLVAPKLVITQHAGGGYTITFEPQPEVQGSGTSLDQAWKAYKQAVNAVPPPEAEAPAQDVASKRRRRTVAKTEALRAQIAADLKARETPPTVGQFLESVGAADEKADA